MSDEYIEGYVTRNLIIKRKPDNKLKIVLVIFAILLLLAIYFKLKKETLINPIAENQTLGAKIINLAAGKKIPITDIKQKVKQETEKADGTWSVYFYDLGSGENFGVNENMILTAASVNKLPILASLYNLIEKGEIDPDKMIVPQPSDIADYGTGSIRYDKPGTAYSIKTLARLMMEKSDNTAAYLLGTVIIGQDKVQSYVESWGMTQTDMKNNKTSVKDMSILMKKMYLGEVTSKELTREMMDLTDDSDFEDRIPKGVPESITVYHKTGNEIGKVHDIAIVNIPGRPYYLGIMTTDTTNEEKTKQEMAKISQIVFDGVANI